MEAEDERVRGVAFVGRREMDEVAAILDAGINVLGRDA